MWFKLDDGIATHPKLLNAGPLGLAIQIRALCYAHRNQTDGYIPVSAVPLLLTGIERWSLMASRDLPSCEAMTLDWPSIMVDAGLWDRTELGYVIHDYLEWNFSKKQIQKLKKKQSEGGKKGMNSRWNQRLIGDNSTYNSTYKYTCKSPSIAISTLNPPNGIGESERKGELSNGSARTLPVDFEPNERAKELAKGQHQNVLALCAAFKDHHAAKGSVFKDWQAAFRMWLRNDLKFKEARS